MVPDSSSIFRWHTFLNCGPPAWKEISAFLLAGLNVVSSHQPVGHTVVYEHILSRARTHTEKERSCAQQQQQQQTELIWQVARQHHTTFLSPSSVSLAHFSFQLDSLPPSKAFFNFIFFASYTCCNGRRSRRRKVGFSFL
jgi:hypothetical protein